MSDRSNRLSWVAAFLMGLLVSTAATAEISPPNVHGYGLNACETFITTSKGHEAGEEQAIADYLSYQDWLAGLVTGLSLATGMDVLQGVEVEGALRRIQVHCDDHPTDDFFTASMNLIKRLSSFNQ